MKITLKGNTSKNKTFFAATEDKPAMLYVDIAEKIKKRDGSEVTVWHKLKVARGYAETIYRGLHGAEPVSRFVQVEGRIVDAPKVRLNSQNQNVAYNTIWVDEITYLDNKWPVNESGLPENEDEPAEEPGTPVEAPVEFDDDTPWG